MGSMLPFSGVDASCPKCRRTIEQTRYCGPHQACGATDAGSDEHLHRVCRCGYGWVERCADEGGAAIGRGYPFVAGDDTPAGDTVHQYASLDEVLAAVAGARRALYPLDASVYDGAIGDTAQQFATVQEALEAAEEARRLLARLPSARDLSDMPLRQRPAGAPGGIAGRASEHDRRDPVVLVSDESFPASDPPAH